jgi:hypothetical protein
MTQANALLRNFADFLISSYISGAVIEAAKFVLRAGVIVVHNTQQSCYLSDQQLQMRRALRGARAHNGLTRTPFFCSRMGNRKLARDHSNG